MTSVCWLGYSPGRKPSRRNSEQLGSSRNWSPRHLTTSKIVSCLLSSWTSLVGGRRARSNLKS